MTERRGDTLLFHTPPVIAAQAAVGGKKESDGPLAAGFDELTTDNRLGQCSWEAAEKQLQLRAARLCLQKASLPAERVDLALAGDLQAQCTASGYALRELGVPFAGLFGACSTMAEALALGADVVVHYATKYLNGHGDVIAGFVVGSAEFCNEVRMFGLKDMTGAVMDPFCAFLILRGLKTLEIRMQKHCANAKAVAEFLYDHPAVEKVYYPGLIDHPGHDIARRQMRDFGGMLSFEVKGGRAAGVKLVNALHLVTVAVSLGDAETLIEHPASMTHSTYTEEELAASGIAAGLIRLSVGLENAEDLIADLKQALDTL